MKTRRYVLYGSAAVVVLIVALALTFGRRDGSELAASPSPASPTPTDATASPATPRPAASASQASVHHASVLGYSIETPAPWHKSSCSPVVTQQGPEPGGEVFVPVSARDETGTDIGSTYPSVTVMAVTNPQSLSPRQWAEKDPTGVAGQTIEDVVYAGRPAARKVFPGTPLAKYFVASGARMYTVEPNTHTPSSPPGGALPEAALLQTMLRMIDSFRFLTETELAAVRAALPTALPPRTPEQVADGVAAGLTGKNADTLAGFLSACVTTAGEQAGGSFVSREKYLDDLRAAFAAGLVVTVRPRPLDGDRAAGDLTVASTWQDSRGIRDRKLMLRRGENERWEWIGTIERFQ